MTVAAAAALVLECFFGPPAGGSVPAGHVQRARTPVSEAVANSLVARQPPVNSGKFEGEPAEMREWVFAALRDPDAASFSALRVSLSTDPSLPSPYAARLGTVYLSADRRSSRFEQRMSGWCLLKPAESPSQ